MFELFTSVNPGYLKSFGILRKAACVLTKRYSLVLLIYLYDFGPEPNMKLSKNIFFDASKYNVYCKGNRVSFLARAEFCPSTFSSL